MGVFVNDKDKVEVEVRYVFDEDDEICILGEEDEKLLKLDVDSKKKSMQNGVSLGKEIIFNNNIEDYTNYTEKDIRVARFTFRKPNYDDKNIIYSSIRGDVGISVADMININGMKIRILFKRGIAQDVDGKTIRIKLGDLGKLDAALASAVAHELSVKSAI